MPTFFPASGFKWIDTKEFDLKNNSSKGCVLAVDLEYPKELRRLQIKYKSKEKCCMKIN